MKIANLPNGIKLQFPDHTSDDVIRKTVRRVLNKEKEPSLNEVLSELADKIIQPEIEIPEVKDFPEIKFPKQEDFYGPALKEHSDKIKNASSEIVKAISSVKLDVEHKSIENAIKDVAEQMTGVSHNIVSFLIEVQKMNNLHIKNSDFLYRTIDTMSKDNKELSKKIDEIVATLTRPKKVVRDKNGQIKGIE